jgi:hypothetical protein
MGGAASSLIMEFRVDVQPGASAWTVGRAGKFAVAWSRAEEDLKGPLDGYQDLTVLDLRDEQIVTTKLSVGYRPSQITINDDETRALVVSDPGISVIDLSTERPKILREIFLPAQVGGQRDVSFSPDGRLALVRLTNESHILAINMESGEEVSIALPASVTDLDMSADGRVAIAVMRGSLSLLDLPLLTCLHSTSRAMFFCSHMTEGARAMPKNQKQFGVKVKSRFDFLCKFG